MVSLLSDTIFLMLHYDYIKIKEVGVPISSMTFSFKKEK